VVLAAVSGIVASPVIGQGNAAAAGEAVARNVDNVVAARAPAKGVYSCTRADIRRQCIDTWHSYCDANGHVRTDYQALCGEGASGGCTCEADGGGDPGCGPTGQGNC
jgi:hypothetical protein